MPNNVHGIFLVGAGPVLSQSKGLPCPIGAFYRSKAQQASAATSRTSYSGRSTPLSRLRTTVATLAAFGS